MNVYESKIYQKYDINYKLDKLITTWEKIK